VPSTRTRRLAAGLCCAAALVVSAPAQGEDPAPSRLEVATEYVDTLKWQQSRKPEDRMDRIATAKPKSVALSATRPAEVKKSPEGSGSLFGQVPIADRPSFFSWTPGEEGRAKLALDWNADGDLTGPGEVVDAAAKTSPGISVWQARWAVAASVVEVAVMRQEGADPAQPKWVSGASVTGARRGKVTVAGVPHVLHLLDGTMDGSYTAGTDRWWFGPAAQFEKVRDVTTSSMIEGNEPVFAPGAWRLQSVAADGKATLVADPNAGTVAQYFARRSARVQKELFAGFDKEATSFAAKQGIDLSRPRAAEETHWLHDVDLKAALAEAQRQKKPLLVDFEADWCVWCYRAAYYLYRDAEVAQALALFVPVKVNYEFHTGGEFKRLNAPETLPTLFVLDETGQPVSFTHTYGFLEDGARKDVTETTFRFWRFMSPQDFAKGLRAAHEAWRKKTGN
jgi:hypothetical protein